jgi:large subunit ribosomal protein L6
MSRIGKLPISIPSGVTVALEDTMIVVKGPKGELRQTLIEGINLTIIPNELTVSRVNEVKKIKAAHGLTRALIHNMIVGVTKGFEKKLEVNGVGFRVQGSGQNLNMALGFSHPVTYTAPEGTLLAVDKMVITVSGIDKQQVGQTAAEIRSLKKPEPYKGKGIKYADEQIIRKAGKTGK